MQCDAEKYEPLDFTGAICTEIKAKPTVSKTGSGRGVLIPHSRSFFT